MKEIRLRIPSKESMPIFLEKTWTGKQGKEKKSKISPVCLFCWKKPKSSINPDCSCCCKSRNLSRAGKIKMPGKNCIWGERYVTCNLWVFSENNRVKIKFIPFLSLYLDSFNVKKCQNEKKFWLFLIAETIWILKTRYMIAVLIILPVFFSSIYLYKKTDRYHFLLFPLTYLGVSALFFLFYVTNMNGMQGLSYFVFGTMPVTLFTIYGIAVAVRDLYLRLSGQQENPDINLWKWKEFFCWFAFSGFPVQKKPIQLRKGCLSSRRFIAR